MSLLSLLSLLKKRIDFRRVILVVGVVMKKHGKDENAYIL
jgi:hypothetical protein